MKIAMQLKILLGCHGNHENMTLDILAPKTIENYMILHRLHLDTLMDIRKKCCRKANEKHSIFRLSITFSSFFFFFFFLLLLLLQVSSTNLF